MELERFERNIRFFGREGQEKLRESHVAVIGVGGTGTHVKQQLSYLGVGGMSLVDPGRLKVTSRNRYIGSRPLDVASKPYKVEVAAREIFLVDEEICVRTFPVSLLSEQGFSAVMSSDYVFGCVDDDGVRLVLTELCSAYRKPLFDLASDIEEADGRLRYGGRICTALDGSSCAVCLGQLDLTEAGLALGGEVAREQRDRIYGVDQDDLSRAGPSVVSLNGVISSLAVTEFMLHVTGIRQAKRLLTYRADVGKVLVSVDEPNPECFICTGVWGLGDAAHLKEKYLMSA